MYEACITVCSGNLGTYRLEGRLASCDHRMLRYMSRVRWQDRITSEEVRRRCEVENLENRLRKMRLRWFGHVKRRDENSILWRAVEMEVEGRRPVGRPKKTWSKVVEEDMKKLNITEDMAEDRKQWRQLPIMSNPRSGKLCLETIRTC